MTEAALQKGCIIEGSVSYHPKIANALFEIVDWWPMTDPDHSAPEKAIRYLVKIGYDIEAQNASGQTPLLHAATTHKPQVVNCLATFIQNGANTRAIDLTGKGALHCALAVPKIFNGWRSLRLIQCAQHTILNHYYVTAYVFHTQSTSHAEDYEDIAFEDSSFMSESGQDAVRWNPAPDSCECGFTAAIDDNEGQSLDNPDIGVSEILCKSLQGEEHTIRHPFQVLKLRTRFKLLTLLKAGCDPNVFDNSGATPSDYARRDGLWQQWSWALRRAGYVYAAESDIWVQDPILY